MSPHISGQLGTENACLTLLYWFIVMIWFLVGKNMYWYERYLTYLESLLAEMVSVISKWVNTDLIEKVNYRNTTGSTSSTDVPLLRLNSKHKGKEYYFHIIYSGSWSCFPNCAVPRQEFGCLLLAYLD